MNVKFRSFRWELDWAWIQEHIDLLATGNTGGIIAIDMDTMKTVGAVILDNWTDNSVQAHIIVTTPMLLKHGLLEEAFNFVFNESGRKIMIGLVKSDNEKSLKLVKKIGFDKLFEIKDYFSDGVDLTIHEMKKENCRFLKQNIEIKEVA